MLKFFIELLYCVQVKSVGASSLASLANLTRVELHNNLLATLDLDALHTHSTSELGRRSLFGDDID